MKKEDLLKSLCLYDKRNPDFYSEDKEKTEQEQKKCFCDNCFHGKTALANYALELYYELLDKEQH